MVYPSRRKETEKRTAMAGVWFGATFEQMFPSFPKGNGENVPHSALAARRGMLPISSPSTTGFRV